MKRKKLIFVCTGNTCRSPMAEAILRRMIKSEKVRWWDVLSRGTKAEDGGSMSENSRIALEEIGIIPEGFVSRRLSYKDIDSATLIVCMTGTLRDSVPGGKAISVSDICGYDIPDPYGGSLDVYRKTRDALVRACGDILEYIKNYEV